jgi:hypothetical protein
MYCVVFYVKTVKEGNITCDTVEFINNKVVNFGRQQFSNHMESLPAPPAARSPRCICVYPTHIANNVGGRAVSGKKAFKLMDLVKYYWIMWPQAGSCIAVDSIFERV